MVNCYDLYSFITMAFILYWTAIILNMNKKIRDFPFAGKSLIFKKILLFFRLSALYYLHLVLL